MKQRTNTTNRKRVSIFLTVIMILMVVSLTGCSKKPAPVVEESKPSTQATVETVKTTEEVVASSEVEVTPEPTVEASEATVEPIVYEGIDMESDLPAKEWIQTFIGVVDEPVVVICNDNTGRKEIIQESSVINVDPDEDMIAVYYPEEGMSIEEDIPGKDTFSLKNSEVYDGLNADLLMKCPKWPVQVTVTGGEEDWVINFTIIAE